MKKKPPRQIALPVEVQGYIQGLKDLAAAQADMIGQRTAEIFSLRAQLAEVLKSLDNTRTK